MSVKRFNTEMLDRFKTKVFAGQGGDARRPDDAPYKDEALLHEMYVKRDMSMSEMAREFGVSRSTIDYWLHVHQVRAGEPWKPSQLEIWYWQDGFTVEEIAEICNVSTTTVRRWMDRAGIDTKEE